MLPGGHIQPMKVLIIFLQSVAPEALNFFSFFALLLLRWVPTHEFVMLFQLRVRF